MELIYQIKTIRILHDYFYRDVANTITKYLFGNCRICNKHISDYKVCKHCDHIFCKSCYRYCIHDTFNTFIMNYCSFCIISSE